AITKRLADVRAPFLGGTCSLTLESQRVQVGGVQLQPLVQAEKGYWGEVEYNSDDPAKLQFEQNRDHAAPLTIAVSVEKGGSGDERVRVNSSRMVLVSNALFVLTAALVVFIKFYETKRPNTEEANRRAQNVVNFERDKIDGVVMQNGEERIELKRVDKKWRLESPVKDLADGSTIDSLLFD